MAFVCLLQALTTRGRLERGFSLELRRGARPRSRCALLSCARLAVVPERGGAALAHIPLSLAASARSAGGSVEAASVLCEALRRFGWGAGRNVGAAGTFVSCSNSGECGLNGSHGLRA